MSTGLVPSSSLLDWLSSFLFSVMANWHPILGKRLVSFFFFLFFFFFCIVIHFIFTSVEKSDAFVFFPFLLYADIIVLLILGVFLIGIFIWWQHHLESHRDNGDLSYRPPLMKLSMWKRGNGKFAAMQIIAFLEWCAFISFTFWAQVRPLLFFLFSGIFADNICSIICPTWI